MLNYKNMWVFLIVYYIFLISFLNKLNNTLLKTCTFISDVITRIYVLKRTYMYKTYRLNNYIPMQTISISNVESTIIYTLVYIEKLYYCSLIFILIISSHWRIQRGHVPPYNTIKDGLY